MNPFSEKTMEQIAAIIKKYPEGKHKSALLPVLHMAQRERNGYLSVETMNEVAAMLNLEPVEVYEVATFYSMFNLQPVGRFVLEVCRTSPCCIVGGEQIMDYLKQKLSISEGETTPDGLFTIKPMECLGSCGTGPVLQILEKFYENLTEAKIDEIIADCKQQHAVLN